MKIQITQVFESDNFVKKQHFLKKTWISYAKYLKWQMMFMKVNNPLRLLLNLTSLKKPKNNVKSSKNSKKG